MPKKTDRYRYTLNLPDTSFPMRANLSKNEEIWIEHQKKSGFVSRLRDKMKSCKPFVLHDGPPYANGDIHMGHAVNKILKDIIVRYKTITGFNAVLVPGWDCHGMPIEIQIEKMYGRDLPIHELFKLCRSYALSQIERQKKDFIRLGVLADWQNPYLTMDFSLEANEVRIISKLYEKGLLTRGLKPVHWCLDCASALAEAEVEYEDKFSQSIDVALSITEWPIEIRDKCSKFSQVYVVIWTTTPWTLPSNQAICVNKSMCYLLLSTPRGYMIVAEDLKGQFVSRCSWSEDSVSIELILPGSCLQGMRVCHPIYNLDVPVLYGDHVTADSGTGIVHTAPAHGLHDYKVCLDNGIIPKILIQNDGNFSKSVEFFADVNLRDADSLVIDMLRNKNTLISCHSIKHSYPHCWRHRTPTIFRATPQWFICLDKSLPGTRDTIRSLSLSEIEKIEFHPSRGHSRLRSMVSSRSDWCLSRQRRWGVPLPFFLHRDTDDVHPRTEEFIERVAKLIEKNGIEIWQDVSIEEWLGDEAKYYYKLMDTVDVWFDSGVTHSTVLRGSHRDILQYPADVYLEGSDQHRGWFHSSLLTSCALDQRRPYNQLITHGFVVDADGYKMSKSRGNIISPQSIIETKGADILRLWVASTDYTREMSLSDSTLSSTVDIYRRIRNTTRFLLANVSDCAVNEDILHIDNLLDLDKYMLLVTEDFLSSAKNYYECYDFSSVVRAIYKFCSDDLGAFYLDIVKDRLYSCHISSAPRRSVQTVLHHIARSLLSVCAPILCFTSDEAWKYLNDNDDYILLNGWHQLPVLTCTDNLRNRWDTVRRVRVEVMRAMELVREKENLATSWEASVIVTLGNAEDYEQLVSIGNELRFVFMVAEVNLLRATESDVLCIDVSSAKGNKCLRCWHVCKVTNVSEEFPGICNRCFSNIKGGGEERYYA
ncbi:isoleucine--tRNA ligase [Candidatus Ichthyocystis sparus]|uniref:isoleucine--tRNA ligase n=1 Tax=Candidatus Ichthyocystis sparus TaxID=1561004 RepID=UPI000A5D5658|nr:isoleucine--tRNA ligase [Candidatus Ichthyocystis sparus]